MSKHYTHGCKMGVVIISVAPLKKDPDFKSEQVAQCLLGEEISLLEQNGKWFFINRCLDQYQGWIHSTDCVFLENERWNSYRKSSKFVVIKLYSEIFEQPDEKSLRLSDLVMGNIIINENDSLENFRKVSLADTRTGWVMAGDVLKNEYQDFYNYNNILELAEKLHGIPYMWGGNSPKGFDCSGFIQHLFRMSGKILPRDARDQAIGGEPVHYSESKQGDLLFFLDSQNEVTHVALYLGHAKFIHAKGYVRINSLDTGDRGCFDPELAHMKFFFKRIK